MKLHGTMRVNDRGHLEIGGCDAVELAEAFGTPLFVMDEALIRDICRQYRRSFVERYGNADVIYAGKALLTTAVCRVIEEEGLGLDVVSGGELYTALTAGFPPDRICFHGNNKSRQELSLALEAGVGRMMVDNLYELELLDHLAGTMSKQADVILRITPGIEAHTHEYIKTGQIDSKFGFTLPNGQALAAVRVASGLGHLHLRGVHCHIGSQIFEMDSYAYAARVMMEFLGQVRTETGLVLNELDLGGGFGIYYTGSDRPASVAEYATVVMETIKAEAARIGLPVPRVMVEPGRSIVGNAGTTLYTVGSIKHIPGVRRYVAVDGGMADNIRPALYGAKYEALVANKADRPGEEVVSITGKCCESGDMLVWDVELPPVAPGDILAIPCTGAYGYTMSSNYNRLGRPEAVLVYEGRADVILRRETWEDVVRNDVIPERLRPRKVIPMVSRK